MNIFYRSVIGLLTICFSWALSAQPYFKCLKLDKGLSLVRAIQRDNKGFLWIGNDGMGLVKFDGYETISYFHDPKDSTSLSNDGVLCILEDHLKNIWIGTRHGLNRYNETLDNFIQYNEVPSGLQDDFINYIYEDLKGNLWVCTSNGLFLYDRKTDRFKHFVIPGRIRQGSNNILSFVQDHQGVYWLLNSYNGIYKFDPDKGLFVHYADTSQVDAPILKKKIIADQSGSIWIGSDGIGFQQFTKETKAFKQYSIIADGRGTSGNLVTDIFQENDSILLIGIDQGGVNRFNIRTGYFEYYQSNGSKPSGLTSDGIYCLYKDYENILWIGTSRGGISYHNPNFGSIKVYRRNYSYNEKSNSELSSDIIGCFFKYDEDHLWIGTDGGGINILEESTGRITALRQRPGDIHSLNGDAIRSITADTLGNIWVATWNSKYLNKYNPKKACFEQIFFHKQAYFFDKSQIWAFKIDKYNRFWVTFINGYVMVMDQKGNKIADIASKNSNVTNKANPVVFQDYDNNYYVYCDDAVYRLNESNKQFEGFIPISEVTSFEQDDYNNFWIGTFRSGIYLYNSEGQIINHYTQKNGLSDNSIYSILKSKNGDIWIATNYGLNKYIKSNNSFVNYYESDGLQGNQFFMQSCLKTKSGTLYFGGTSGFCSFVPEKVIEQHRIHPLSFTYLYIGGNKIDHKQKNPFLDKHLNAARQVTLDYHVTSFSIGFTSPDLTNHLKIKYAYKLEGFDKEWTFVDYNTRKITYTNLDPGEYSFCITAVPVDVNIVSDYTKLKIIILPPWWERTWVKTLAISILILGVCLIYYTRVHQLERRQKVLERVVKKRTSALSEANMELSAQKEELESTLEALRKTQEQLLQSERMASIAILTAGVAHEINNPLNFIKGGAQVIEMYIDQHLSAHKTELQPLMEMIEAGINRASDIVQSLNQFNVSNKSYDELCEIESIIGNCLDILKHYLTERIKVIVQLTCTSCKIYGNRGELHQVFLNILLNSIQSIEGEGTIRIESDVADHELCLKIIDSGCGISGDDINKVTIPFFTTKPPNQATGLGMSIAYSIIKRHNGTLNYQSVEGFGTTVTIKLPFID